MAVRQFFIFIIVVQLCPCWLGHQLVGTQFTCDSGETIPFAWRCDTKADCQDTSDETNCQNFNPGCKSNEFQCTNGLCLSQHLMCDTRHDCPEGSDEHNCPSGVDEGFQCNDHTHIPWTRVCNGLKNCLDGIDELNCHFWINRKNQAAFSPPLQPNQANGNPANSFPSDPYRSGESSGGNEATSTVTIYAVVGSCSLLAVIACVVVVTLLVKSSRRRRNAQQQINARLAHITNSSGPTAPKEVDPIYEEIAPTAVPNTRRPGPHAGFGEYQIPNHLRRDRL